MATVVAASAGHTAGAVATAATPGVAASADFLGDAPSAGVSFVAGLDRSVVAPAAGILLPSRDPAAIVAGWAWTEPPAEVGGSWAEAPAASEAAATADASSVSPSEGPAAEAEPVPLGLDRIAASLRVDLATLDAAIERGVEGVDDLGDLIADLLAGARPAARILGAAAAVAAGVAVHRLAHRRRRTWATEAARDEALNPWALGPIPEAV